MCRTVAYSRLTGLGFLSGRHAQAEAGLPEHQGVVACGRESPAWGGSGSWGAVLDGALRRRVHFLGRHEHRGADLGGARSVDRQSDCRGALIVGEIDDRVDIALAEREVEALKVTAHALGERGDRVTPAAAAGALDSLDAFHGVARLDQVLRHEQPPEDRLTATLSPAATPRQGAPQNAVRARGGGVSSSWVPGRGSCR